VTALSSKFQNAGRTIVTDNFFTSSELGQQLLKKQTRLLGTIRRNRQGNPKDFIDEKVEVQNALRYFITSFVLGGKNKVRLSSTRNAYEVSS
jgi:hypothetical protein